MMLHTMILQSYSATDQQQLLRRLIFLFVVSLAVTAATSLETSAHEESLKQTLPRMVIARLRDPGSEFTQSSVCLLTCLHFVLST